MIVQKRNNNNATHDPSPTPTPSCAQAACKSLPLLSRWKVALVRRDHGRVDLDTALVEALAAGKLLEAVLAELEDRRAVDGNHVHRLLVLVLELPARGALARTIDCVDKRRSVKLLHYWRSGVHEPVSGAPP